MRGEPSDNPTAEPATVKYPKRFWWTKRLVVLYVLLAVGIVAARYIWLAIGNARVAEQVRQIEARGESLDWVGMEPPPIPPAINAAEYYKRAAGAITLTADHEDMLNDLLDNRDFRAEHADDVRDILAANQTVFDECRAATPLKDVNWGIRHRHPGAFGGSPNIDLNDTLVKLLALQAIRQSEQEQIVQAIQTLRDAEALARATSRCALTGHTVAVFCEKRICGGVQRVIDTIGAKTDSVDSETELRDAVDPLITDLLDEYLFDSYANSILMTRAAMDDTYNWAIEQVGKGLSAGSGAPRIHGRIVSWLLLPMYRDDQARLLSSYEPFMAVARQPTAVLAERVEVPDLPPEPETFFELLPVVFSRAFSPFIFEYMSGRHDRIAQRRLAATALALALYRREHGDWPEKLEELVPEYLPAVPVDTFDPDGGPIRALLNDPVPRLYSCGDDFVDDGGKWDTAHGYTLRPDIVFFLRASDIPQPTPSYPSRPLWGPSVFYGPGRPRVGPPPGAVGPPRSLPPIPVAPGQPVPQPSDSMDATTRPDSPYLRPTIGPTSRGRGLRDIRR